MKPNSENKDPEIQIRTQNAKKVLIKDQVLKIRTLLDAVIKRFAKFNYVFSLLFRLEQEYKVFEIQTFHL